MLSLIFGILMILVFGKLIIFAIKAAWGLTRVLLTVVLLPLVLLGLVAGGLMFLALPVLLLVGLGTLIVARV